MGKSDLLKEGLKGGLNGLLSPTSTVKKEEKEAEVTSAEKPAKEKAVHCNFVIDKSIHTRMKYLAIDKNMSLREIVNVAMREYLERNEKK
jgi:hypothetical protein